MRVAGEYLATSLTVMENDDMPFLFGLDMMRRHQVTPYQIDEHCLLSLASICCSVTRRLLSESTTTHHAFEIHEVPVQFGLDRMRTST